MSELFDTHCHIHFPDYQLDPEEVIERAKEAGVTGMLAVGCSLSDSKLAVDFAKNHADIWAAIGLHPHESARYVHDHEALQQFHALASKPEVVSIGEIGLDYHYMNSPKEAQKKLLKFQLDVGVEHNLPFVFHVRDAFDDFWDIFDEYKGITGVVHSFSAHKKQLDEALKRNLYIGLNGIMTFTKDEAQLEAAKSVPLERMVLETDAPFLTPSPYRGTICEPKHVRTTAEFLSDLRGESLEAIARASTNNARQLFNLIRNS